MRLTILQTGLVPVSLADRFPSYPEMFRAMFERDGARLDYEVVRVEAGQPLPDPKSCEAVVITGSSAGVYETHSWLPPLRDFIRGAYAARTKMVGICFGHQVIADALGGEVRKSEKGWGLGRHSYEVVPFRPHFDLPRASLSIACSHQDQVIVPPSEARVILRSPFAPNAGLAYANGAVLSVQPHPEFDDVYARALIELRRGRAPEDVIDAANASMCQPSDSPLLVRAISRFLAA